MTPPPDDPPSDHDTADPDETLRAARLESLLAPRLTVRQRAIRAMTLAGTVVLAVALLCALVPDLRLSVQRALTGPIPVPTSMLAPGEDALWFTPLAPGETLTLDGHALSNPPLPGDSHPLQVSRGTHRLAWNAAPFQPQHCVLSVPRSPDDTCPITPALEPNTLPNGRILDDSESLATLADPLRISLSAAIAAALSPTYSAEVAPGEYYRSLADNAFSPIVIPTRQPLRASLRIVQLSGWTEPCASVSIAPCRAQGQDCEQLCTLPAPTARLSSAAWYVGLTAAPLWTYATADGHVIERGAPDTAFSFGLLVLRVTWDGANWGVTPVLGAMPGLPAAQDITCAALANDLDAWVAFDVMHPYVNVRNGVRYVSDGNPTDGCVGVVTATSFGSVATPTPVIGTSPLLLHRFGVLLAANAAAHALWPGLPLADAAEMALAARIAA